MRDVMPAKAGIQSGDSLSVSTLSYSILASKAAGMTQKIARTLRFSATGSTYCLGKWFTL